MKCFRRYRWSTVLLLVIIPGSLLATGTVVGGSEANQFHLDGASLSIFWALPFIGILFSIAIFPLVAPLFWHHHFGKISFIWALLVMIPLFYEFGHSVASYNLLHTALLEYIPFIILLLSLFTISGGVCLTGTMVGTPLINTLVILVGTVLASWMGGAQVAAGRDILHRSQIPTFDYCDTAARMAMASRLTIKPMVAPFAKYRPVSSTCSA